ncbi:MAG: autotransporter outer membrane beta-barrel domain-containing protein [Rhodospirillaceae bacterium]|nr:MAG: autotransporter outer membrane beta-barrel domain-containing protein [Rhodospirillaceae bacterium]
MLELLSTSSRIALSLFIIAAPSWALADDFSLTSNSSASQTITGDETGTVGKGVTLSVDADSDSETAITWDDGTPGKVTLTNNGTIQSKTDRAFDTSGSGGADYSLDLTNNGSIIGFNDSIRVKFDTAGVITLVNSGTIASNGGEDAGQAIDFGSLTDSDGSVNITNKAGGVISSDGNDAIAIGDTATLNLTNAGKILASNEDEDVRGIDISNDDAVGKTRNISILNDRTGLIHSDDDAVRIDFDVNGGTVTVENRGTIISEFGQAIDFNALENDGGAGPGTGTATFNIINTATGVIQANNADGIRPGQSTTVTNYGHIVATNSDIDESSDGIDFQDFGGKVINKSGGVIEGLHAGVTGSDFVDTLNEKGGTIIGHNGSGVNLDGNGKVVNYGTISGNFIPGAEDGDGDGVDIDGKPGANDVTVENYGLIEANGATGVHNGPIDFNIADGVAFGGGNLYNASDAVIRSVQRGVFVDDSEGGAAFGATKIENYGTIQAGTDGITLIGSLDDTIINGGLISAGSGMAIDMGGGNDTLDIIAGSRIIGTVDGGDDTDTVILEGGNGTFDAPLNFEVLEAKSGTWTLNGAQRYGDGITVDDTATLLATGALTGDLTVKDGGGFGQGGTTAAGSTLNVDGNVTFESGATYQARINAAGDSDLLHATGTADLDGHLVLSPASGIKVGGTYTVFTADGGVTGNFADVTSNAPRLKFTVTPNGNDIDVETELSGVTFDDLSSGGHNQQEIADALDKASDAGVDSSLLDTLNGRGAPALSKAMDSLTGEAHSSLTNVSMETAGQFGQAISGRIGTVRAGNPQTASLSNSFTGLQLAARNLGSDLDSELAALPVAVADASGNRQPAVGNDFWLRGYGTFGSQDGDSNATGYSYSTGGIAAGYDHHLTENLLGGVSIGYSRTTANFDGSSDEAKIDSYDIGLYSSYDTGSFYVDGIVNYSYLRNKAERDIVLGGTTDHAKSDYSGNRIFAYGEAGYVLKLGETSLQPLASLQYTWLRQDNFKEHGAGGADLTADASTMNSLKSGLGLRISYQFQTGDETFFVPELRARWMHEFLDTQSSTSTELAGLPGSAFTVKGIDTTRNGALVGAGFTSDISSAVAMMVDYDAFVSADQTVHNISGGFKIKW